TTSSFIVGSGADWAAAIESDDELEAIETDADALNNGESVGQFWGGGTSLPMRQRKESTAAAPQVTVGVGVADVDLTGGQDGRRAINTPTSTPSIGCATLAGIGVGIVEVQRRRRPWYTCGGMLCGNKQQRRRAPNILRYVLYVFLVAAVRPAGSHAGPHVRPVRLRLGHPGDQKPSYPGFIIRGYLGKWTLLIKSYGRNEGLKKREVLSARRLPRRQHRIRGAPLGGVLFSLERPATISH
uniref:AP2/ERF domain-containing protein n=1 Tax=Macrostomum lignano TaxID=282301 RepID=A0A1I8FLM0_9PLAT